MSTLLIRLDGPQQSWGTESRFRMRETGMEPSKSGVVGLLCAALGKPREEHPDDGHPALAELTKLRMGVRVDRQGVVKRDYQTAGGTHLKGEVYGVIRAHGKSAETVLSDRYYLADAAFLVGLESENQDLLKRLHRALKEPFWPLSLGRKAFVPGEPVYLPEGLSSLPLEEALRSFPWLCRSKHERDRIRHMAARAKEEGKQHLAMRLVLDAPTALVTDEDPGGRPVELRHDVPVSFADRRFTVRRVLHDTVALDEAHFREGLVCTSHD